MKKITNKTILKQGDNSFRPVEVDGIIYWITGDDFHNKNLLPNDKAYHRSTNKILKVLSKNESTGMWNCDDNTDRDCYKLFKVVSQYKLKFEGIPVINLDNYIAELAYQYYTKENTKVSDSFHFVNGYKTNPNQYTLNDIQKVIELAKEYTLYENYGDAEIEFDFSEQEIINKINSISIIEIDENFNIISYE